MNDSLYESFATGFTITLPDYYQVELFLRNLFEISTIPFLDAVKSYKHSGNNHESPLIFYSKTINGILYKSQLEPSNIVKIKSTAIQKNSEIEWLLGIPFSKDESTSDRFHGLWEFVPLGYSLP